MTAVVTGLLLLAGPFVALGIWLWLRSRRAPVPLAEPLDMGRVLGNSFAVFRPENGAVPLLSLVLIGLPSLVWQLAVQPAMQAGLQIQSRLPIDVRPYPFAVFGRLLSVQTIVATLVYLVALTAFYVAATLYLVRRFEDRSASIVGALKATPMLVVPAFLVALLAYVGSLIGGMLLILPGFVLALSWSVVIPVLVVERTGMIRCFRRSRALAIGSRGRIFLLLLLMFVLGFALSAVTTGVTIGVNGMGAAVQPGAITIAMHVIVTAISGSLFAAFFAALYVELRRIREGMAMPELAELFG